MRASRARGGVRHCELGARVRDDADRRLHQVMNTLPQLVWAAGADGSTTFVSERWTEFVGVPTEQLLGEGWLAYLHPDDRARVQVVWQASLTTGAEYHVQVRIRRHDGMYRWFDARGQPLRDESGRIVEWFGSNADIHDAREMQELRAREAARLERLIATAPGVAYTYRLEPDGSSSFPTLAAGGEELYGIPAEELARDGNLLWMRMHPEDREVHAREQSRRMRTLEPFRGEFRLSHPTRGLVWIESTASPVREPSGAIEWVGFVRDITERKQSEGALRTMQAQLVAALEAGGMGFWQWDVARDALRMDDLLLKLLGRRRAELSGTSRDAYAFAPERDAETIRATLHALATQGGRRDLEHRIVDPEGRVRWLSVRASSERDEHGAVFRVTALHIDITQHKQVTEARLRSQKLEALGTLAGGIAHDFNNILQAITGNTTLALLGLPREHPVRGFLDAVAVATTRASELVRRILSFSRPSEPTSTAIALAGTVQEALKLVRATLPTTIAIDAQLDVPVPRVAADASQIHRIVVNLATNAAHAIGPKSGTIYVRLEPGSKGERANKLPPELAEGEYVVLHVRDDGAGIAPASLPRIFDPFYTTKPVGQGTGLGLSVVHGIMKGLGGAITVRSELGHGTEFSLYFPTAGDVSEELEPVEHARGPSLASGERVLFVDDEPMLVTLGTSVLRMLGYEPVGHTSAIEALRDFEAAPESFAAAITDAAMPVLSGYELAERMLACRRGLPVLMLSGYVGPDELQRAQRIGVRELLLKPARIDVLHQALARALAG